LTQSNLHVMRMAPRPTNQTTTCVIKCCPRAVREICKWKTTSVFTLAVLTVLQLHGDVNVWCLLFSTSISWILCDWEHTGTYVLIWLLTVEWHWW